jgi:hypothetical protein
MSSDSLSRQAGVFKLSVVGLACAPFLPTMDQCEPPGPGIASHFLPTALNKKAIALGGPAKPLSKSDENPPLRHYPCRLLALSRHSASRTWCPLLNLKRTSHAYRPIKIEMSASRVDASAANAENQAA